MSTSTSAPTSMSICLSIYIYLLIYLYLPVYLLVESTLTIKYWLSAIKVYFFLQEYNVLGDVSDT